MNSLVVAKFGGTSVANYQAMQRCANIVNQNTSTRLVVVSASAGVTNALVALSKGALSEQEQQAQLDGIREIQSNILAELASPKKVLKQIDDLLAQLSEIAMSDNLDTNPLLKDELLSFGERMSSVIFAQVLNELGIKAECFDAREVMKTDNRFSQAQPDLVQVKSHVEASLVKKLSETVIVTQGFIGSDDESNTTTLGRGGSDFSAAILAEALAASELHIWTDVSGIFTTDPRITSNARAIPEISFDEAAEMAIFGAKILHPATLIPAIRSGTRVFVGSSREPEKGGTWVLKSPENRPAYRAIALRREQTLLTLKSPNMLLASGFLANVFAVLARHKVSVDLITTSEISVALTIDNPSNSNTKVLSQGLLDELAEMCQVRVEDKLALVAVIGNRLQETHGVSANILSCVEQHNLRMICHGASQHNFCFLIEESLAGSVITRLHKVLFEQQS
ncbi:lysine-sensitive aspartokinase 3 [Alteromonas sp. a30]|uniref:lysine-sensitive aspartokinase 3 n=1 Tax=Alteromonas sp. a30 TaxID=2730917 RepID=UPI0022829CF6|nr:lysine-sensitive aspartokinase 3 [Alteromonas sp. a30]MCY7296386.1 lysine-sensitive aspartokinase 3 [Alteromonas sp. a30]